MSTRYPALESLRARIAPRVDWFVYTELARGGPRKVYEAALYLYKAGGKRVRPFITIAVARLLAGDEANRAEAASLPLAAAVEVFHNFTLIHDDIMDQDDFRRGVPTTHKVYGEAFAILGGDLAYALSYKAITLARQHGLGDRHIALATEILTEAAVRVSEGQALDMMFEETTEVDYQDYLEMIYLKTGALIEAAAKMGVVGAEPWLEAVSYEAEADELLTLMGKLGLYGKFIGLAFQIRDDILGVYGDPKITGKPRYNDLLRGKKTLLVLYAYKHAEGDDKELLRRVLERRLSGSEEELERVAEIIRKTGALSYATRLATTFSEQAATIIREIAPDPDSEEARALVELARFVVERQK